MFLFQNLHRCLLQQELHRTSFTAHASVSLSALHLSRQQPVRLVCASASLHCLRAPYVNTSVSACVLPPTRVCSDGWGRATVMSVRGEEGWTRAKRGGTVAVNCLTLYLLYTPMLNTHVHTHAILWARVRHSQAPKQTETVRLVYLRLFYPFASFLYQRSATEPHAAEEINGTEGKTEL